MPSTKRIAGLSLSSAVLVIACSSSTAAPAHGGTSPDGGGAEGGTSSGGASGLGGASSTGGASGASGAGVGGSIQDVSCGSAICKPLADQSIESRACCTDATLCGYRLPISS